LASAPVKAAFWRWSAINASLLADAQHLILASGTMGRFAVLELTTDNDCQREQSKLAIVIDKVYAD
jgi:hypothetical protein